ncbi:cellulose-binding domain-containing protein [Sphaerisporangium sp. TRM90804]|uniref:cellulose-binding domain-containing protein n=1 Tax=Sphaerisporangium sp. TRM90804 TaxID=3031113 RepID=UPI00244AE22F|nr:cellulose-binding domain-containing protein [Sphaerisporangium sp. TRM90804]MDH2428302.1 cellulose-binding domain-containing protein [Sphaerisporangium sp. TRM90804]
MSSLRRSVLTAALLVSGLAIVPAALAAQAADTSPPTRPTNPIPCPPPAPPPGPGSGPGPTLGYASICWTASTDDVGVTGYDIYRLEPGGFAKATSTTGTMGGFSGVYGRRYTMYVVARDAAGNTSPPSSLITVTASTGVVPTASPTPTPGDVSPPSQPAGFREPCLADFPGVSFCWQPSTDDVGVTAYDVYRETATGWLRAGTVTILGALVHFTESGLVTGNRYTYVVVARDAAGNLSTPSAPLGAPAREGLPRPTQSATPTAPAISCHATYSTTVWHNGLTATVTIRNTGTVPLDGWTVVIEYASSGIRLTQGWSATFTQSGSQIRATNTPWNRIIPPGGSIQIGYAASYTGTPPVPVRISVNGVPCTMG